MHDMTKAELVKLAARLAAENARLKAELAARKRPILRRLADLCGCHRRAEPVYAGEFWTEGTKNGC